VDESIAGTIENKARYQTPEIAAHMERNYRAMKAAGIETYYTHGEQGIEIDYQHYQSDESARLNIPSSELVYCDPSFDLGRKLSDIKSGMLLVQKIGKQIEIAQAREREQLVGKVRSYTFENPERVLATLRSMRGVVEIAHNRTFNEMVKASTVPTSPEYSFVA
jgi:hypothetical protein